MKDQKFESTLDRYYNKVDESQSLKEDQELFEQKVNEKIGQNSLNYFHQESSSYYKQSQSKFENEVKNFE